MNMKIGNVQLKSGTPKLLTHVGVTYDISSPKLELEKALMAVAYGADIIADASLGKNCRETTKLLCENIKNPVTCLPGYVLASQYGQNELDKNICANEILEVTEEMLSYGVKGLTFHPVLNRRHLEALEKTKDRVFPFTSRMGHYIKKYMHINNKDNPFYDCFPEIVSLAKKYDANISIGIALRSPSIANKGGFDELVKMEIEDSKELIQICNNNNVSVTLEAGGHIALDAMPGWFNYIKQTCNNVPLRVLVLSTDRGMGHDNVSGAISATYLARMGVELICTMTRAEHISQPTLEDIKESVINFKIALESAHPDMEKETLVAKARAMGGCHLPRVIDNVIDPQGAYDAFFVRSGAGLNDALTYSELEECTMCGESCPIRN